MADDIGTFINCLTEIVNSQAPSPEAIEYFEDLRVQAPALMIDFLINVILDDKLDSKIRLSAIRMITVPFKFPNEIARIVLKQEIKEKFTDGIAKIYNAIKPFLFIEGEVGDVSRENLAAAIKNLSSRAMQEMSEDLLGSLDYNTPLPIIIKVIQLIYMGELELNSNSIAMIVKIAMHFNDRNLSIMCIKALYILSKQFISESKTETLGSEIEQIFYTFAPEFPDMMYKLLDRIPIKELTDDFEKFSAYVIELYFSDLKYHKLAWLIPELNIPLNIDFAHLINYTFQCGVVEMNCSVEDDIDQFNVEMIGLYDGVNAEKVMTAIKDNLSNIEGGEQIIASLWEVFFKNIQEYISSSDEAHMVVAADTYIKVLLHEKEKALEYLDPNVVISAFPEDKSDHLGALYLLFLAFYVKNKYIEPTEEIIQGAFEYSMSENYRVADAAGAAVTQIATLKNDEVNKYMWERYANTAFDNLESTNIFESCFRLMDDIALDMSPELAAECCASVFENTVQVYNENKESIVISKLIHSMCGLIKTAQEAVSEIALDIVNFATSVFDDFEDDSLSILARLCKVFKVPEIIDPCANIVVEKMKDCDSEANFHNITKIAIAVIKTTQNEEILIAILQNLYPFLSVMHNYKAEVAKKDFTKLIYTLYSRIPDIVRDEMPNLVANGFVVMSSSYDILYDLKNLELFKVHLVSSPSFRHMGANCLILFLHILYHNDAKITEACRGIVKVFFTKYPGERINAPKQLINFMCESYPEVAELIQAKMQPWDVNLDIMK